MRTFDARLLESVRALPGVQHAGITSDIPFGGDYSDSVIIAEGYQMAPGESLISPYRISVSRGYFEAMAMTPVYGRVFNDSDTDSSPRVVIVDQKLARRFWGDSNPVGRRMFKPDSAQDITKPGPKANGTRSSASYRRSASRASSRPTIALAPITSRSRKRSSAA